MRFATRPDLGLNRPPAIWFLRRFLGPGTEILLLPKETIFEEAARCGAVVFHVPGAELHMDKERGRTTLDAILDRYGFAGKDPALDRVADYLRDASYGVPSGKPRFPESAMLRHLNLGFRSTVPDDFARMDAIAAVYDALYAWCAAEIEREKAVAPATTDAEPPRG